MNNPPTDRAPSLQLAPGPFMTEVRRWLGAKGTSQAILADRAQVSKHQLNRWIRGHVRPSLESRVKMRHGIVLLERELEEEGNE